MAQRALPYFLVALLWLVPKASSSVMTTQVDWSKFSLHDIYVAWVNKTRTIISSGLIGLFGGCGKTTMAIRRAADDPNTKAIVLRINSPGGQSHATALLSVELKSKCSSYPRCTALPHWTTALTAASCIAS